MLGSDAPADDLAEGHSGQSAVVYEDVRSAMREGYIATRANREALNRDWGAIDVEGWPA